jgi:hypothetical protein
MKNLTRSKGEQLSVSSHIEIMKGFKKAVVDASDLTYNDGDKPVDQAALINAWILLLTRIPFDVARQVTELAIEQFNRWQNGQRLSEPETLRKFLVLSLGGEPGDTKHGDDETGAGSQSREGGGQKANPSARAVRSIPSPGEGVTNRDDDAPVASKAKHGPKR